MRLQSDLFDRFVTFARRNLPEQEKTDKVDLRVGSVIETEQGDFMVMMMAWNTSRPNLEVTLSKIVDGKVEYK